LAELRRSANDTYNNNGNNNTNVQRTRCAYEHAEK